MLDKNVRARGEEFFSGRIEGTQFSRSGIYQQRRETSRQEKCLQSQYCRKLPKFLATHAAELLLSKKFGGVGDGKQNSY